MLKKKICILGAGTWGIALARMLSNSGHSVTVWSAIENEIDYCFAHRSHPKLPNVTIPEAIVFTSQIEAACIGKDIIIFAVPSVFIRSTATKAAPFVSDNQIFVSVAKGIEPNTLHTMSEIISEELQKYSEKKKVKVVVLSGPTHAEEVAKDMPTTIVSACSDLSVAKEIQDTFMNTCMRVYTNPDVKGVELCGAMKNIIALASGISSGLGYGDNTKAAIVTRGMAEITRLGLAMGCHEQTFCGLAGVGDLIVTCMSEHSRNNKAGKLIGQGCSVTEAIEKIGMTVEGINALPASVKLSSLYGVELPIISGVDAIITRGADPNETVKSLMMREKKTEF